MYTRNVLVCTAFWLMSFSVLHAEFESWIMYEEWYDWHAAEEFAPAGDGKVEVEVHFVGPGAITPRSVYIRGDADARLEDIRVSGMKDHEGKAWESLVDAVAAGDAPEGKRWVRLASGRNRRGFQPLILELPEGVSFDYALIGPNERYVTDGRAERWIRDHQRGKQIRCGMPLGGIGAGKVEIARDGWLRNITTNNNIDAPFYHPAHCALVARINGEGRILRDEPFAGLKPIDSITMEARYPIAQLEYADPDWPIDLKLVAWSPIIPRNVEDSALPAALFEFEVHNTTGEPVNVEIGMTWQNMIGSGGRPKGIQYYRFRQDDGNTQKAVQFDGLSAIELTGPVKKEPDGEGHYLIASPQQDGVEIEALVSSPLETLGGRWTNPFTLYRHNIPAGGLLTKVRVEPRETQRVPIVLTWCMDHFYQAGNEDLGHYYHMRFRNAREVARYVIDNSIRLRSETDVWQELVTRSHLPEWMIDMLLNDNYVLSTDTWLTRDGRFSVNEGASNMYGVMGTMDQKLYASHSIAMLFPELQKAELRQFGLLQNADGGITHDLGAAEFADQLKAFDWPDLCSSFSFLSWQMYRATGDQAFWDEIRPKVLLALEALATTWDPDNTGVPGNGSTFDDEDSYRIFSYTTGLWLTHLRLGMEIARQQGDEDAVERYQERFDRAHELAMKELWTGTYFRYGSTPKENKRTDASHFSQLAGEFWARTLGFESTYDASVRQKALESLFALHWNENFQLPPKIVTADGKLFPRDDEHRNAPVSWPMHSRVMMAGNAFYFGMAEEGFDLLKRMRENIIAANGPDPWDQSLYWDPITAELDWGIFYMTAPASWLAYQAMIDTHYDAVDGTLTINPVAAQQLIRRKVSPGETRLGHTLLPVLTPKFHALLSYHPELREMDIRFPRLHDMVVIRRIQVAEDLAGGQVRAGDEALSGRWEGRTFLLETPHTVPQHGSLHIKAR